MRAMNRSETLEIIRRHSLQPTRSLGQNFLVDDRVIGMAVSAAAPDADTLVIEIGPGLGGLTRALAIDAGRVLAIEIDRHILPALQEVVSPFPCVDIVHADAMQADFKHLTSSWQTQGKIIKVAANLPYYITSPLVEKLISELPCLQSLTLMVQKEAGDRLAATPGSRLYGPVAILAALFGSVKKLARVPASAFYPKPHVDSVLIHLQRHVDGKTVDAAVRDTLPESDADAAVRDTLPESDADAAVRDTLPDSDTEAFLSFLNDCFSRRRKTLVNSLGDAGWSKEKRNCVRQILSSLKLAENVRPEQIKPEEYARIYLLLM